MNPWILFSPVYKIIWTNINASAPLLFLWECTCPQQPDIFDLTSFHSFLDVAKPWHVSHCILQLQNPLLIPNACPHLWRSSWPYYYYWTLMMLKLILKRNRGDNNHFWTFGSDYAVPFLLLVCVWCVITTMYFMFKQKPAGYIKYTYRWNISKTM